MKDSRTINASPLFDFSEEHKTISIDDFAQEKIISSPTLRLWIKKTNILPHTKEGKRLLYLKSDLEKIYNLNVSQKLTSRANKKQSERRIVSKEHFSDTSEYKIVKSAIDEINMHNLDTPSAIYYIANSIYNSSGIKSRAMDLELKLWRDEIKDIDHRYRCLDKFILKDIDDPMGIIYTSLLAESLRSTNGMYMTPKSIYSKLTIYHDLNGKAIDPCCGSGNLLMQIADTGYDPNNIYGIEKDPVLFRICRFRMILRFPQITSVNIFNLDFLSLKYSEMQDLGLIRNFSAVIMNPPWGGTFEDKSDGLVFSMGKDLDKDTFSLFMISSSFLLKDGGQCISIVPEAILRNKTYSSLRNYIEENFSLKSIEATQGRFHLVSSQPVVITFNAKQSKERRFSDFLSDSKDDQILDKIYSIDHYTLRNNADFALGIVTGDNKNYIYDEEGSFPGEPVILGADIEKFNISQRRYLRTDLPYQQAANIKYFRAKPKIIYRFIGYRLKFAVDYAGMLTLNSCNILIPKNHHCAEVVCAIFNSKLINYLHHVKHKSNKLLRSHIESFPIPLKISEQDIAVLRGFSLNTNTDIAHLDSIVYRIYGVEENEIDRVNEIMEGI